MHVYQLKFHRQGTELKVVQGIGALPVVVIRHQLLNRGLLSEFNIQHILKEPLDPLLYVVNTAGDVRQVLPGQQVDQRRAFRVCGLLKAALPVQAKLLEIDVGLRQLIQSGEDGIRVPLILGLIEPQERLFHILDHGLILPDIQTQQSQKTFRKREVFFCQRCVSTIAKMLSAVGDVGFECVRLHMVPSPKRLFI